MSGYLQDGEELSAIELWLADASKSAAAKFEQRIRMLRDRPAHEWHYDYAHKLSDADGVFEIRFEAGRVAHRPLCMFGPAQGQFTVLCFAIEHNGKWRPPGALRTAMARKNQTQQMKWPGKDYDPDQ